MGSFRMLAVNLLKLPEEWRKSWGGLGSIRQFDVKRLIRFVIVPNSGPLGSFQQQDENLLIGQRILMKAGFKVGLVIGFARSTCHELVEMIRTVSELRV